MGKAKLTPQTAKQCVTKFLELFPGIVPFTQLTLFDEGENEAHDLCNEMARTMNGGSSLDNWKQSWKLLILKKIDDAETTFLILGIRLASSPPEIDQGWIGDALLSTTITDTWVGEGEVFGELWIQDTLMEEVNTVIEDFDNGIEHQEELTQLMSTLQKNYDLWRKAASLENLRSVKGNQSV